VKDFNGINNRYGQIAVPDFIEYLARQIPVIFNQVKSFSVTRLQCSICHWISFPTSHDLLLKLYIPPKVGVISLDGLISYNFTTTLTDDTLYCGTCKIKTSQNFPVTLFQI